MVRKGGNILTRVLVALSGVIVILLIMATWYVNDYYHADDTALDVMADDNGAADGIVVQELSDKAVAFVPEDATEGLVFYPGAKVQPEAYAPLLQQCAEQGVLCILVRPLFNLPILDGEAANGAQEQFPAIESWTIAGHSMGGVVASNYALNHPDDFEDIAFLASYPMKDLSDTHFETVSLVGSNDKVLNWDNYTSAFDKLPAGACENEIEGGNHAYFGNYGEQAGDGQATITREQQQKEAADVLTELAYSNTAGA